MHQANEPNEHHEMALEVNLFSADMGEVALAVMIASMVQNTKAFNLEVLAHRCGLSEAIAEQVIYDAHRGAHLLGKAHRLLKLIADLDLGDDLHRLIARRSAEKQRASLQTDGVAR